MNYKSYFSFTLLVLLMVSCSNISEYDKLKTQGLQGEELYKTLLDFDNGHPTFFESKLDLGCYNLLIGNYAQALKYLSQAETLLPLQKRVADERVALLLASLADLYGASNELEKAEDYAKRAFEIKNVGSKYGYTYAKIALAQNNEAKALDLFEKTYENHADIIGEDEIRSYMYLLASTHQFKKCKALLEQYFENGKFFQGLGIFAANVYKENKDYNTALYSAFLDYEYISGNEENVYKSFLIQAKKIINEVNLEELNSYKYLNALCNKKNISSHDKDKNIHFVEKYIFLKTKIQNDSIFLEEDFSTLLSIEKYFSSFASYYWLVWQAAKKLDNENLHNWKNVLEKIIVLNKNSSYAKEAKIELGNFAKLSKNDSASILLASEVENLLYNFSKNVDKNLLEDIHNLLTIPDCSYVYDAIQIAKVWKKNPIVKNAFLQKEKTATGRLKERLNFVLYS